MKKELLLVFFFFITVASFFFYPIFKGNIPFSGDLLVGSYFPYTRNTYEGYGPGAVPNKGQGIDVVRQLFPWKYFAIDTFKNHQIPFWNPYNFSGNPLLANFQSAVFYPFNMLFFLFTFNNAWTIYIFIIPLLTSFFMYLFLKELKISLLPSMFGAIVFAFSSYMVFWLEWGNVGHTFLWLPLVLLFTEKIVKKETVGSMFGLVIVLVLSLLAGYIQGYFYIVVVAICYFFARSILERKLVLKKSIFFLFGIVLSILLTLFQTLPSIELFAQSARGNYNLDQITKLLNPLWFLITVLIPNFFGNPASRNFWFGGTYIERVAYIGLIPLVLALFALTRMKKQKEFFVFGLLFFTPVLLSTDLFITRFFYMLPIPTISTTVPTRILSIFVFSASILSAYGLELFLEKKERKILYRVLLAIGIVLTVIWVFAFLAPYVIHDNWVGNLSVTKRNLVLPSIFFAGFLFVAAFLRKRKIVFSAILVLTVVDLFLFFHKITPFSPKAYVFPKTELFNFLKEQTGSNRVWGYGSGYIDTNFQTYEKVFSTDGYDPLYIRRYEEFLSTTRNGKIDNQIRRSDANIQGGFGTSDLRDNFYRQQALDILGVKYIVHEGFSETKPDTATFDPKIYSLLWQKGSTQVYENKQTLPRAFLAANYIVENDKQKIIDMLYDKNFPLRDKIILEEVPKNVTLSDDKNATLEIKNYSPNSIEIDTKSNANMLLFLSDNYFPGWAVSIDERNDKIYRADYSFRAVVVPKGEHHVTFSYYPTSFDAGWKISTFTFVMLLLFLLFYILNKDKVIIKKS